MCRLVQDRLPDNIARKHVAEIDQVFVREEIDERPRDRQPPHARVEHADRTVIHECAEATRPRAAFDVTTPQPAKNSFPEPRPEKPLIG